MAIGPSGIEEGVKKRLRGRHNRTTSSKRVNSEQVFAVYFTDNGSRFLTNQYRCQVIPHSVVVEVDITVETACCNQ